MQAANPSADLEQYQGYLFGKSFGMNPAERSRRDLFPTQPRFAKHGASCKCNRSEEPDKDGMYVLRQDPCLETDISCDHEYKCENLAFTLVTFSKFIQHAPAKVSSQVVGTTWLLMGSQCQAYVRILCHSGSHGYHDRDHWF